MRIIKNPKITDIAKKVSAIEWIRGVRREHHLINVMGLSFAYSYGLRDMGIKSQKYALVSGEDGVYIIFRPKKKYQQVLKSILEQFKKDHQSVLNNLKMMERVNKEVDNFCKIDFRRFKTKKEKINFLNNFLDLVNRYWSVYIYTTYLIYAFEQIGEMNDIVKKALALKNATNYLKLEKLFEEILLNLGLDRKKAKLYIFDDIKNFLTKEKKPEDIENKKIIVFSEENNIYFVIKDASRIHERIKEKLETRRKLKGIITYQGKVRGNVVVINTQKDYKKIKKGDIIAIAMTRPNIVPYLEKVKAIVTDEGGMLCHASIISREMKIPCIVGTKIATKVLKDGMFLEVDADKGIVKKIEKRLI